VPPPEREQSRLRAQPPEFASYKDGSWVTDYPLAAGDALPPAVLGGAPKLKGRVRE
jgi:hypothetical protein